MDFFSSCKNDDDAKSVYRKLSLVLHPDKSGNKDLMVELNRQYNSFKSRSTDKFNYNAINPTGTSNNRDIPFDHPIHTLIRSKDNYINQQEILIGEYRNKIHNLTIDFKNRGNLLFNIENEKNKWKQESIRLESKFDELNDECYTLQAKYDTLPKTFWQFIKRMFR